MGKMFTYNGKRMVTWNPFTGCNFNCSYCWARKLAETKLKASYPEGFIPTTHPDRLNKRFKPDDFVFVCSMGDIAFAPSIVIEVIISTAQKYPETKFLLCTKDPEIYRKVVYHQPNIYFGTTLETDRQYNVSRAPSPLQRLYSIRQSSHSHKFVSIEPIMDFNPEFVDWILTIKPEIVEIGADNYGHNLPEPSWDKVAQLMGKLRASGITVIEKDGLERLLGQLSRE